LGPDNRAAGAFYYGFVGFGEEGLFRGALYPGLSHVFGSYWLGALTSSALFAVSHLPNKQAYYHSGRGLAELFVFGMILCAQTTYNHFDLRHSIFTHAWYDFVIDYESKASTASASLTPELRVGFRF
jgi:membrane protease YdiL (CAAX protease family)